MSSSITSSERQQDEQEEFGLYFLVGTNDPAADEVFRIIAREGHTKLSEELTGMIPTMVRRSTCEGSTFDEAVAGLLSTSPEAYCHFTVSGLCEKSGIADEANRGTAS
jgi:hypothetical protein